MKNGADYFKGFFLIFFASCTYLICRKMDFSWDFIFSGGMLGKTRIIVAILWVLFGNIYGAVVGLLVGFWYVFR